LNELVEVIISLNMEDEISIKKLTPLLQISGDSANDSYKSKPYNNEILVNRIIYISPSLLVVFLLIYYFINF